MFWAGFREFFDQMSIYGQNLKNLATFGPALPIIYIDAQKQTLIGSPIRVFLYISDSYRIFRWLLLCIAG